jgi:hypothetical protein
MFVTHKDFANDRWNVFYNDHGEEDFVDSFDTLEEAEDFCAVNNNQLAEVD